jgi:hypothetical protein
MSQMSCRCGGRAILCERCAKRVGRIAREDERRRIMEDPSTRLFGLTLDHIRRLIEEEKEREGRA